MRARRSSSAGLPVTAGSPKAPRRSSRSWKARPAHRPAERSASRADASAPASAAPSARGRSTVYRALFRVAMLTASSSPDVPVAWAWMSRYCPATISPRMARHSRCSPGPCGEPRAVSVSRSSAQARARSPASTAADVANASGGPVIRAARCRWARSTCTAGAPRRRGDPSITSSWMRAHAWRSSRAAPVRRTAVTSPDPPAARHPHHANAVRSRFPPRRTSAATRSATSWANTGSVSRARHIRSSRTRPSSASTARTASWAVNGRSADPTDPAGSATVGAVPACATPSHSRSPAHPCFCRAPLYGCADSPLGVRAVSGAATALSPVPNPVPGSMFVSRDAQRVISCWALLYMMSSWADSSSSAMSLRKSPGLARPSACGKSEPMTMDSW